MFRKPMLEFWPLSNVIIFAWRIHKKWFSSSYLANRFTDDKKCKFPFLCSPIYVSLWAKYTRTKDEEHLLWSHWLIQFNNSIEYSNDLFYSKLTANKHVIFAVIRSTDFVPSFYIIIIEHIRLHLDKGISTHTFSMYMLSSDILIQYIFRIRNRKLHKYDKWFSSPSFYGVTFLFIRIVLLLVAVLLPVSLRTQSQVNKTDDPFLFYSLFYGFKINGAVTFANWTRE